MTEQNSPSVKAIVDELVAAQRLFDGLPPDPERTAAHLASVASLLAEALPVPGVDPITRARVALSLLAVAGIDINPYAVSIARFRLTIAALFELGIEGQRLDAAPPEIGEIIRRNVGWADALLPADHPGQPYLPGGAHRASA